MLKKNTKKKVNRRVTKVVEPQYLKFEDLEVGMHIASSNALICIVAEFGTTFLHKHRYVKLKYFAFNFENDCVVRTETVLKENFPKYMKQVNV